MIGAALVVAVGLSVIALLVFAVSAVGFLVRISSHKPSKVWAAAAGASLILFLVFGSISQAISGGGERTLAGEQASAAQVEKQGSYDTTATVTRVVDGDTVDISPTVEGLSRVRVED